MFPSNFCLEALMADRFLSAIYTYPIKSCGRLEHTEITLDERGPAWDRRWMVVDSDGSGLTQRELPAMALIQPRFEGDQLALTAPGMPEICVPLQHATRQIRQVDLWKDFCDAWDEGDDVSNWFSDYLSVDVRLARMAEGYVRPVDPNYAPENTPTRFTDGFPLLIVSEASLEELNRRLVERGKEALPMARFRPNLVVSGAEAFAEDTWKTVQIGELTLDVVKPCARCVLTTVDPATGTIPDAAEPLATLNTFRKQNGKVMFAQNAIHHTPGTLRVGDQIEVVI
jgi:uncharacterized protein